MSSVYKRYICFYKSSCRARAGKPGDDDIINIITFRKDPFIMPIYNEKLYY
jgi:hypothetical protein